MKIREIIPIIDDVIGIYNKNRAIIAAFGDTDVEKIVDLVHTIKGLIRR